jgi:hypothetical protein
MKKITKTLFCSGCHVSIIFHRLPKIIFMMTMLPLSLTNLHAQSLTGSTWDLATQTPNSGYHNWGSGVISLTDTVTGSGTCQGSAVTETSGYNPTTDFSKCFMVLFGCLGNDQIGTSGNPYTDQNGDGLAFSFWKQSATMNANNTNTCGGGLGYENSVSDAKMITIEFDTYSSIGTNGVDNYYGGGAPGSGVNDEISLHKDANSNDVGLITTTAATNVNAGNLEDGLVHQVCINYTAGAGTLAVTIDGITKLSYALGATYNLNNYFSGATLNYSWSAGKYGANNLQTIGPVGTDMFATIGHNPCTGAVALPVELLTFTGKGINERVVLTWATANEKSNKKFIIERSDNLSDWEVIGEQAGAGNSGAIVNYSFTDETPLDGIAYYRLQQVDVDGTVANTNIVAVENGTKSLSIMPNPFDDALEIRSNIKGAMDISIFDILGRLVFHLNRESENGTIDIQTELASGAYVISIQAGEFIEWHKIIRK